MLTTIALQLRGVSPADIWPEWDSAQRAVVIRISNLPEGLEEPLNATEPLLSAAKRDIKSLYHYEGPLSFAPVPPLVPRRDRPERAGLDSSG